MDRSNQQPDTSIATNGDVAHDGGRQVVTTEMATQGLVGHEPRDGEEGDVWIQRLGAVALPDDWEFLSCGNAFVTRRVKKGPHVVLKGPYNRRGNYRPVKGVYAPSAAIREAEDAAGASKAVREKRQVQDAARREKAEVKNRLAFERACIEFLDFARKNVELARQIARETAEHACEKHSKRVGRTAMRAFDQKVELAVRAHIRHNYTDYDKRLPDPSICPDEVYRQIKAAAQEDVDEFLDKHRKRRRTGRPPPVPKNQRP